MFLLCVFCRLEIEADQIRDKSGEALNTSQAALDLAEDALSKPDALRGDLQELEFRWVYLSRFYLVYILFD